MPLPKSIGRLNRLVTNRITELFAGRVPPFAIIEHTGRRSGRIYRTPIMTFRSGDGFVVALTYGAETDWVRNVLAAGGATLEHHGKRSVIIDPRLTGPDEIRRWIPAPIRLILRLLNVDDFLLIKTEATG